MNGDRWFRARVWLAVMILALGLVLGYMNERAHNNDQIQRARNDAAVAIQREHRLAVQAIERERIVARNAYLTSCAGENEVRAEFLGFLDSTLKRARLALEATLNSPASTQDQKDVASRNLLSLEAVSRDAHVKNAQKKCVYPPAVPKGTP